MSEEKTCGTCKWKTMETRGKPSVNSSATLKVVWLCNNDRSDYYGCDTMYDDSCEEWEE